MKEMRMFDYNKAVKLVVLVITFFLGISSLAMGIDKEIAKLKDLQSDMTRTIEKKSGGNSTMEYRAAMKINEKCFSEIDQEIRKLETLKEMDQLIKKLEDRIKLSSKL